MFTRRHPARCTELLNSQWNPEEDRRTTSLCVHSWIESVWGQNKLCLLEMMKDHVIRLFCFQPIALQRAHLCYIFLDIHLEALSLFTKHRSLLIAVWDWLDCFAAQRAACRQAIAAHISQSGLHSAVIVAHLSFCHWLADWLDAEGWTQGGKKCPISLSQAKKCPSQLWSDT